MRSAGGAHRRPGGSGARRLGRGPARRATVLGHLALPLQQPPLLSVHAHVSDLLTESGAGQEGLEPPTAGFGDRCSAKLSYCPLQMVCGVGPSRAEDSTRSELDTAGGWSGANGQKADAGQAVRTGPAQGSC